MHVVRILVFVTALCSALFAQGSYSGTTTVPSSGNTMTLSQPTNSSGTGTTATSLEISDSNKTYKRNVDYTVTGLPGQNPVVEWLPGKRPADGTKLTIAGDTAAVGSFTTSVTWS